MSTVQFNILPYVAYAFGLNKKSYHLIDKVYNENKEVYFSYAANSEYYNKPPVITGTPLQIEYTRKILGILLYFYNTGDTEIYKKLVDIFKKSFNYLYQLIQSYKEIEILKIMEKFKEDIYKNYAWTGIIYSIMTLFGASLLNKPIKKDEHYQFFINIMSFRERHDLKDEKRLTPSQLKAFSKEGKILKEKLEKFKPQLINCEFVGKNEEYIESLFAFMMDVENVSILEILEENMDSKTLDEIFAFVYVIRNFFDKPLESEADLQEAYESFIAMFYVRALLKEFNKYKEFYLQNADIVHERDKLKIENENFKQEIEDLKKQIEALYSQREILLTNITKLQKEIKNYEKDLQELAKLREVIFEENIEVQDIKEELDLNILKSKKLVIIGGIKDWVNGLKKCLSDSTIYLEAGRVNYDENSVFQNTDLVVFNTKYLSHTAYYKAINVIKKYDIPYLFINHNNVKLTLKEIISFLKKEEES